MLSAKHGGIVSFKITYEPLNRIAGVGPKTVEIDSVEGAWLEVHGLMNSDERVTITENGSTISWQELRDRANQRAN